MPVLRSPEKGKRSGILVNVLSPRAAIHPWFCRFAQLVGPSARLRVEIESFSPGSPHPTRIEAGPLTKLGGALKQRYGLDANALTQSLQYANCSARLIAEADDDMTEAALEPESLETTEQEET